MNSTLPTRPPFPSNPKPHLRRHESRVTSQQSLGPFLSTDPKNSPVTPFAATLPKLLDFKSFPCHTCEIPRGCRYILLTRNLAAEFHPAWCERRQLVIPQASFFTLAQTSCTPRSNATSLLSFHTLTNCSFFNPFVLRFMHGMGGVYAPSSRFPRLQGSSDIAPKLLPGAGPFPRFACNLQLSTFNLLPLASHQSRVTTHGPPVTSHAA